MSVPRATTPTDDVARLRATERVRAGAAEMGASPQGRALYERAAKDVMDAQLDGTLSIVTPSGAPSQLANRLAERYASDGITSPYMAQKFIDGVLKLAGQKATPAGLGMAIQ